ncbi:MAG: carbohydrate binding family 9 domain-containing protein [Candidatus Zixiibacteriota bacterium]|nr:MAG: carbohydrate binding family 9 domain-containing protein [candidate division Zixibacteria bacterium]
MISCDNFKCATILLIFSVSAAPAITDSDNFKPVYKPELEISKINSSVKIDGSLDDDCWKNAVSVNQFVENNPGDQVKPDVETKTFITYDDSKLYVAFICYDKPEEIRASFCERDKLWGGQDNIGVFIDTYGDAIWAYTFNVNPYGVQMDALWSPYRGEDGSYDLIWDSAARITDHGYQVEMAIPFSSLRFPNKDIQTWRMDFYRHRYRDSHYQYSWAAYDRDEPCWPCQWGTVSGIKNVTPGKGIEFLPSVITYQSGYLDGAGDSNDPFDFINDDPDGEFSLGARYAVNSNITAEGTYNPDFSQVESDEAQIDLNTTFALFYPERRPFFQEGSDLFGTWSNTFYSRTINDPEFAGKFTSRLNRSNIAYLVARDEHTPIIVPFEDGSAYILTEKSVSNFGRFKQSFGTDSYIGLLITDRRLDDGGSGSLIQIDNQICYHKNWRTQFEYIRSFNKEPDRDVLNGQINGLIERGIIDSTFNDGKYTSILDGESFSGYGLLANIEERSRHVNFDLGLIEFSPTYRADNGFRTSNNQREITFLSDYRIYFEDKFIEQLMSDFDLSYKWNFEGETKKKYIIVGTTALLKGRTQINPSITRVYERFRGIEFDDIWHFQLLAESYFSELLGFSFYLSHGHLIARQQDPPVMGKAIYLSFGTDIKPVDRMLIESSFDYTKSDQLDSGENLYKGYVTRTKINYQFNPQLSMRMIFQYDDIYETFDFDPLLTYRISPFSVLYLGSTYRYTHFEDVGDDGLDETTRLTSRQYFMKLQYLFQM